MSTIYDVQLPKDTKVNLLREEFAQLNIGAQTLLSYQDLITFLDRKNGGRMFDREVADQLYERIEKDQKGQFHIDDFIVVFIEAEEILKRKVVKSQDYLRGYQQERQNAIEKLREVEKQEQLNAYGIMVGSTLKIHVKELVDLLPGENYRELSVKLLCEKLLFETERIPFQENVQFDQYFDGEIVIGHEDLQILVLGYLPDGHDEVIGEVTVPISKLRDQCKHDEYFDLFDQNGHLAGAGTIHVMLQWIHSEVKFLSDVIKKWGDQIQAVSEELNDYSSSLNVLFEGFNTYKVAHEKALQSSKLGKNNKQQVQKVSANLEPEIPKLPPAQVTGKVIIEWQQTNLWGQLAFSVSITMLVLGVFSCFGTADYLSVIIGLGYLMNFDENKTLQINSDTLKNLLALTGLSTFLTLIWLCIYSSSWNGEVKAWEPVHGTYEFALVMEWFLLFLKGGLTFFFFKQFQDIQSKEMKNPNIHIKQDVGYNARY